MSLSCGRLLALDIHCSSMAELVALPRLALQRILQNLHAAAANSEEHAAAGICEALFAVVLESRSGGGEEKAAKQ